MLVIKHTYKMEICKSVTQSKSEHISKLQWKPMCLWASHPLQRNSHPSLILLLKQKQNKGKIFIILLFKARDFYKKFSITFKVFLAFKSFIKMVLRCVRF